MPVTPPAPGELALYDALQPGIKDGAYSLTIGQEVSAAGAAVAPVAQAFSVEGPRFALDPAELHSQFPPPGSSGPFDGVLPHVTLSTRLLPWEREIPGLAASVPWLAVLVFEAGELQGDRGTGDFAQVMSVADLLAAPTGPVRVPALTSVTAAQSAEQCRAITIDSTLFSQLVPTAAELPLLAHVRSLDPGSSPVDAQGDAGTFSVVVGNRFPVAGDATHGATTIVHLVSLEGFGDLLGGAAPAIPTVNGTPQEQVRLVSLASWTFSCLADPAQTFSGLATNLSREADGTQRTAADLLLRLPVSEPAAGATDLASQAQRRLAEGYIAAGYHASSGEDGFAWYRGPFIPVVPSPAPAGPGFATASAAMAFDPATGIFDHTLSAAWSLGRGLALSSEAFATALMRLRVQASAALEDAVSRDPHAGLAALFEGGGVVGALHAASAGEGVEPVALASLSTAALADAEPEAPIAELRTALAAAPPVVDPTSADAVTVTTWLAQLALLVPVPLAHLVPDARMLPAESLRTFYVDPQWVAAATAGAMSVGVGTSRDLALQASLTEQLEALAATAALAIRADALGVTPPPASPDGFSGILLRSAIVTGWPGLTITGTRAGAPVPLLRLDQPLPGLTVAIFDGVPDTITIAEPFEGLKFGLDVTGHLALRSVQPPLGTEITPPLPVTAAGAAASLLRAGGLRVLNVRSGPGDLFSAVTAQVPVAGGTTFGPAALGLQLMMVPEHLSFTTQTSSTESS